MAKYEVLDDKGLVANTIIASRDFVESHHPGRYRLVADTKLAGEPIVSVEQRLTQIIEKLETIDGKIEATKE